MKTYIILAYPNESGLTYAAYEKVKQGLEDAGHEIRVSDLYKDNFDPILIFNEEKKRRDIKSAKETETYRENILWAERIVFLFPIWWAGMPAILKGFIDKVFATGFAYDFKFKGLIPIGNLKGKTAWIVNTYDAPALFANIIQQDYGKVLKRQILGMCGIKTTKHFVLAFTRRTSIEKRTKWLDSIYKYAKNN